MWHFISLLTFLLTLGTPCERISCQNGGYCIQPATATTLAYCHCPATYTGYRCEQSGRDARGSRLNFTDSFTFCFFFSLKWSLFELSMQSRNLSKGSQQSTVLFLLRGLWRFTMWNSNRYVIKTRPTVLSSSRCSLAFHRRERWRNNHH